jgi:PE-PPE domain-containing protein
MNAGRRFCVGGSTGNLSRRGQRPAVICNRLRANIFGVTITSFSFRRFGVALFAGAGAGLLSLPTVVTPCVARGDTDETPFYVLGGSGLPAPSTELIDTLQSLYFPEVANFAEQPTFSGVDPVALTTPEQFYPVTGVYQETLATSVSQGVQILDNQISPILSDGGAVDVFGISQSAIIASLEMEQLEITDPDADATFVLAGDLMNPNGGILERFAGLDLSSLGIDFYGATPSDDFTTTVYTLEYDGYADFPKYPLDILSDLNAIEGINVVHGAYADLTAADLGDVVQLTTAGATDTTYYIIPVEDLPLLDPVRDIPVIGNPIADLLQPDLTYLVNLGYGDPEYGYSTDPANEATTFGFLPDLSEIEKMPGLLLSGVEQGIQDFIGDFTGTGPNPVDLSLDSLTSSTDSTAGTTTDALTLLETDVESLASDPSGTLTNLASTISSDLQTAYSTLLPTADILNSLLTSLPAYDATLFVDDIGSNPIDAIGLPIAADLGVGLYLANYESDVLATAADTILGSLTS